MLAGCLDASTGIGDRLPPALVSGALGQTNALGAINARATSLARLGWLG
jgi:hypothetical protein